MMKLFFPVYNVSHNYMVTMHAFVLLQVDIISAVCHSITKGHTVVMNQTEDIHECFYDLFNLRFYSVKDSNDQWCYFANVAIGGHIKPIRVSPDFQCVVVLKQSELMDTPSPFLNRFEKYKLSHETLFKSIFQNFPLGVIRVVNQAFEKVLFFCYNHISILSTILIYFL